MGNDDYTTALNTKHERIIRDLQELQAVETYLFTKIQEAASSHSDGDEQNKISGHIEKLSKTRETLLKELQALYTGANDDVNLSSSILGNQTVMSQQLNEEIKKTQQQEKRLIAEKNNKQRLAQIGEYEYAKNTEHKSILKIIVYGSFFVLVFIFLNTKEILPLFLTKMFIAIICFFVLLRIIKKLYWNFKRDNIDYSKFRYPKKTDEVYDKQTENTFNLNDLFGVECKDKTLESEELATSTNQVTEHSHNSGYRSHIHSPPDDDAASGEEHQHRLRIGGAVATETDAAEATETDAAEATETDAAEATETGDAAAFTLLNKNSCKSCKNIFPSNNLNNSTFKNTSLKFSTVN